MAQMLNMEAQWIGNSANASKLPEPIPVVLQSSGGKPLRIYAELIAECSSWTTSATAWYDLLVYTCTNGEVAIALRTCRRSVGEGDVFRAKVFSSLKESMKWLQDLDPTNDLVTDLDVSDRRISAADIVLRAATLRQRMDLVQMQYLSMVGELFYRLDLRE